MQKSVIINLLLLLIFVACQRETQTPKNDSLENEDEVEISEFGITDPGYMLNPEKSDTMCINAVERAKIDLKKNDGVFTQRICYGCKVVPYLDEIREVLNQKNFKLYIEDYTDAVFEGQTVGCYGDYTDRVMKQKFGYDYYKQILDQAEKKFIFNLSENDSVISIYDLSNNEKPKLKGQNIKLIDEGIMLTVSSELSVRQDSNNSLFIDLGFIVEKNGSVSNFKVNQWVNDFNENENLKSYLVEKSISELKSKYNSWIPGNYKGHTVRTQNNLRMHFN